MNSRGTTLELADYDEDFINYVFNRPLIEAKAPWDEIRDTRYYYAVLRGVDFDKMIKTGRIPIGREKYYPLNWCTNPIEATRFMDYLINNNYESIKPEDLDLRLVALPLDQLIDKERKIGRAHV